MSELNASLAADVAAACRTNALEASHALQRALDGEFALSIAEPLEFAPNAAIEGGDGPGLAVVFKLSGVGAALLIPESSGLLPSWYRSPDATGKSKLGALAQELSMLLLPDSVMADGYAAGGVASLAGALAAAMPAQASAQLPLTATRGDASASLSLIWPLGSPDQLLATAGAPSDLQGVGTAATGKKSPADNTPTTSQRDVKSLPVYSRSLLKIAVPVSVELAHKREVIKEIVELAPGTILSFDKSCDELLRLIVGGQAIAEGEAVKVGDKFGFRVCSMLVPRERFEPLMPGSRQAAG